MSNIYQYSSNASTGNHPILPSQNQGPKEVSIDVSQLVELNKNDLNEFKQSGLKNPAEFLKKKKVMAHGAPVTENLDIQFKKPKVAYYEKKEVFLPSENERYTNPKGVQNHANYAQSYVSGPAQTHHVVYSQPQTQVVYQTQQPYSVYGYDSQPVAYVQTSNQNVVYTQPPTSEVRYVQSTPHDNTTYKRIVHKLNGEVVEEDIRQ